MLGVVEAGGLEAVPVGDIKIKPTKSVYFRGGIFFWYDALGFRDGSVIVLQGGLSVSKSSPSQTINQFHFVVQKLCAQDVRTRWVIAIATTP